MASVSPNRLCSKCGTPTDGKARTLCASCRRKAKFAAHRAGAIQNTITVQLSGSLSIPTHSLGSSLESNPRQPPNLTKCLSCEGSKQQTRDALCQRCAVALPLDFVEAYALYWNAILGNYPPKLQFCEVCGGGYSGKPVLPPCPQCENEHEALAHREALFCCSCGETSIRFRLVCGQPVCELCSLHFAPSSIIAAQNAVASRNHRPDCKCFECKLERFERWRVVRNGALRKRGHSSNHLIATQFSASVGMFQTGGVVPPIIRLGHQGAPKERINLENPDPDRAPDLIEPVLAWRGWNVTPDGHLVAAVQHGIWDAGENRAHCNRGHTDIPAKGCSCGLYGWHRPEQIAHGQIWGAIKCRGEIIVHDVGIRAEYAEIICIVEAPESQLPADQLARIVDRYKVPVFSDLEQASKHAAEHGILVPSSMKPEKSVASSTAAGMAALAATGIPAAQAFQGMQQAIGQLGKNVNASAGAFGVFMPLLTPLGKPAPTDFARWLMGCLTTTLLLALWIPATLIFSNMPAWSGLVAGIVIAWISWWTRVPAVLWRFGRALRCLRHGSHKGGGLGRQGDRGCAWRDRPDPSPRRGRPPLRAGEGQQR